MEDSDRLTVHVVAGVLRDADGRVLLAQRPAGRHLAGGWEFPGGKLERGEDRLAGLVREIREELDVEIGTAHPLMCTRHAYPDRRILLDVWAVTSYRGTPRALEGQGLRWCSAEDLAGADLLPADRPLVTALRLPARLRERVTDLYEVLSGSGSSHDGAAAGGVVWLGGGRLQGSLCADAAAAAAAEARGAQFLVLEGPLPAAALCAICGAANVPVYARGMCLDDARALGAAGVSELAPV